MTSRGAGVAVMAGVVLLACGTRTWSFDGDGGTTAEASGATSCSVDSDCVALDLHCDPGSGQCVPCIVDSQCSPPLPRCVLQQCVQCAGPGDCPGGQTCETPGLTCVTSCADGGSCPQGTSCDTTRGVCVGCSSNADCATSSAGHVCDVPSGRCVQCLSDAQCAFPTRRCNPADDQCVQCLTGADCDDHVCNTTTFTCAPEVDD